MKSCYGTCQSPWQFIDHLIRTYLNDRLDAVGSELSLLVLNCADGCLDVWNQTLDCVADLGRIGRCELAGGIGILAGLGNGLFQSLLDLLDLQGVGDTASIVGICR